MIEETESGTILTGRHIGLYRLNTLLYGLKVEIESGGKRRLTRGRSCYAIIKSQFGFKGNKEKVYNQLQDYITERKILKDNDVYGLKKEIKNKGEKRQWNQTKKR